MIAFDESIIVVQCPAGHFLHLNEEPINLQPPGQAQALGPLRPPATPTGRHLG